MLTLVHFICEPLDRTTLNTRGSRALGIDTRAVAAEVTRVPQPLRFGERRAGANLPEHVLLHLHQMRPLVALGHVLLLAPLRHVPLGAATPRPPQSRHERATAIAISCRKEAPPHSTHRKAKRTWMRAATWRACRGWTRRGPARRSPYSDAKVANRHAKVWHGATENGP